MKFIDNYFASLTFEFLRYKSLGDKTFEQLNDDDIHWMYSPNDNSIAIIVKHISGNMLSRFTNFLTEDGEKPWRNRESEFNSTFKNKSEMIAAWEKGWECLFNAMKSVNLENFETIVKIRNEKHTITEAFNRQLAHYANHIGQIILLGKMIKGTEWKSLSIPKGESDKYNSAKFSK